MFYTLLIFLLHGVQIISRHFIYSYNFPETKESVLMSLNCIVFQIFIWILKYQKVTQRNNRTHHQPGVHKHRHTERIWQVISISIHKLNVVSACYWFAYLMQLRIKYIYTSLSLAPCFSDTVMSFVYMNMQLFLLCCLKWKSPKLFY